MKLRIKGNSLRLRLSRTEVRTFLSGQRLEDSVRFAPASTATLTYALEATESAKIVSIRYHPSDITVLVPLNDARILSREQEVGIYPTLDLGNGETLEVLIEKDFACLDRSDEDNADTFDNPLSGTKC